MEIQILSPTQAQPLPPVQWNYEEVKAWIESGLERYKGVVYDETQIAQAKADRAALNKLVQAIAAKRREMKQTYLVPYEQFDAQTKELEVMVKQQSAAIDAQVKAYDNFRKEEKRAKIEAEIYAPMIGDLAELVPYDRLHEAKWLNVTCSMTTIGQDMAGKIENILNGLSMIGKMDIPDDIKEQGKIEFLKRFSLSDAVLATERIVETREAMARRDTAMAAQKSQKATKKPDHKFNRPEPENGAEVSTAHETPEENIHVVSFRIRVNTEQLKALGDFMRANGIKPERI